MRLPPGGAVTGWAALRLRGANFHDGLEPDGITPIPVPLAVGTHGSVRRDPRISVGFERLSRADWSLVAGIPTMLSVRATFDEMRRTGDLREAVVALDMAVAAELLSIEEMGRHAATSSARNVALVRQAVPLASEHSRSPNETRLRLIAVLDAGLTSLEANCPVHDVRGAFLGEADLLDVEAGLVIEFDGADHRDVRRQSRDVVKDDLFRERGLEVVRVTGPQLYDGTELVRRLRAALGRARFQAPGERLWVARPRPRDLDARLRYQREFGALMERWDRELLG